MLRACLRAVTARFRHGCDTLYYIPAPGKRGALYRDWVVMLLCRPFFKRLVLHWHAAGLDEWLATEGRGPEHWLTRQLLGRPDLSIVLGHSLIAGVESFTPKRAAVVFNGINDPGQGERLAPPGGPLQVFFLGLCSEEKGLFAAADAVLAANRALRAPKTEPKFTLVAAGGFPDFATGARFRELCDQHPASLRYTGPVHGEEKTRLFRESHCLCLPTHYLPEGQPLVLLEAMAHDLPIVATRWRAIPETLPSEALLVEPGDDEALKQALLKLRQDPPAAGIFRQRYLDCFTTEKHLAALSASLQSIAR